MKSFLQLKFIPLNPSLALLLLRLWLGGSMLALHGWTKLQKLINGDFGFSDPIHIGAAPTLVIAVICEVLGSVFLIAGFLTRLSALLLASTMAAVWGAAHNMKLSGPGNGELAFIYLGGYLALLFAGAGKYSVEKS